MIIGVKRGSGARKTNEAIETSVDEDAVQIALHIRIMTFRFSTCKAVNNEIGRASYKNFASCPLF